MQKSLALVFSRGIWHTPHLAQFLPEYTLTQKKQSAVSTVLGWGLRPTTKKARDFAKAHNLPYIALEDGFLRSLGLGCEGYAPFSMVIDNLGIYYDTTRPSRLEQLILSPIPPEILTDAQRALGLIVDYKLSKYNHAPNFVDDTPHNKPRILVIDQTFGDMAVRFGQADENTFNLMLDCALAENPNAEIWVKTHPDVISGKKQGYLTALSHFKDKVRLISDNANPLSLLECVDKVYCVTSQMGFEALMLNKPVVIFGVAWFAGWGLTDDRHPAIKQLTTQKRRANRTLLHLFSCAYLQYSRYINPVTGKTGTIFDVIDYLNQGKQLNQRLAGNLYCIGMSLWKRAVIKPFFQLPSCKLHFFSSIKKLQNRTLPSDAKLLIWGQGQEALLHFASLRELSVLRMEDGFIRSVGLGSNLVAPLSLVIDDLGIYFNGHAPSRLEYILQNHLFTDHDRIQGEHLQNTLVTQHIGKYNVGESGFSVQHNGKKVILVPGQVEDDASIRFGSPQIKTNLALLHAVRQANPNAYIIYKPHPDVVSGNRIGYIDIQQAQILADEIVEKTNILDCINCADEVHTMTSLSGFEALLRGKKVFCYGLPFYANWGLTYDAIQSPRRTRTLKLSELVVATLVYYPQYIDPTRKTRINAQRAIEILQQQRVKLKDDNGLYRSWCSKQIGKLKQLYLSIR
ncbi:capsular polysaccharide biosynthesis protein [Spirabiliibacterium falconis]|uniref:capsular polysaccharide biosynthesis protein n=1 Tax=Spirabiliibacterium falconis TaxID=572023 RepID=UPI001F35007D|nr:capsular polysaccharide biosynthesis protein [Spirabiliibacterium falconis]